MDKNVTNLMIHIKTYIMKTQYGFRAKKSTTQPVHCIRRTQATAIYLRHVQWGKPKEQNTKTEESKTENTRITETDNGKEKGKQEENNRRETNTKDTKKRKEILYNKQRLYNAGILTIEELNWAIWKLKKRKATGTDDMSNELVEMLDEDSKQLLLDTLNKWWETEQLEEEYCKAKIVSIFKKGDPKAQQNYRPIALLNVAYRIFAFITKHRVEQGLESYIMQTG